MLEESVGEPVSEAGPAGVVPVEATVASGSGAASRMEHGETGPSVPSSGGAPERGQPQRRGRGRPRGPPISAEERREKNRQVQARYREKQRSMLAELETRHAQTAEEIERERGQFEAAAHGAELLAKRLSVKEAVVAILERGRSSAARPTGPGIGNGGADNTVASLAMASAPLVPRPTVHSLYQQFSSDFGAPLGSIADGYEAAERLERDAEIARQFPLYGEVMAAVRTMTGHQLIQGWRTFALQMRVMLERHEMALSGGAAASSRHWQFGQLPPALAQVEPLFQEQVIVLSTALRYNLPAMETLFATVADIQGNPKDF